VCGEDAQNVRVNVDPENAILIHAREKALRPTDFPLIFLDAMTRIVWHVCPEAGAV
jgi:hypothetical protein